MRRAVLLGAPDTKRTCYLEKAAGQTGVAVTFLDWRGWREHLPDGELFLKIDPPRWDSCSLKDLDLLTGTYREELEALSRLAGERQIEYLNTPAAIALLLDKRCCKAALRRAGLPVTELLEEDQRIGNTDQLLEAMRCRNVWQVFVKPVCGSGAAGVSAFRLQPGSGRMMLYTCALYTAEAGLVHTKRLYRITEEREIRQTLDGILKYPCVVERWYAKAAYKGSSYDLRAVMQGGRLDYLLARLSRGPITNLHLNNRPLPVGELGLSLQVREEIEALCRKAADCFPGLWSVGIDILLGRKHSEPRIIEMNAQGDLIYQDIYQENIIYRRQAERMKAWACGGTVYRTGE